MPTRVNILSFRSEPRGGRASRLFLFAVLLGFSIAALNHESGTFENLCVRDYACVRVCPVKAIELDKHGFPRIDKQRCIAWNESAERFEWGGVCSMCLLNCSTRALLVYA